MAQQEWLYGLHAMQSVLENEPERVLEVLVLKGRDDDRLKNIINQARRFGISVQFCQRKVLDDKVQGEQHQGVVARAKPARRPNTAARAQAASSSSSLAPAKRHNWKSCQSTSSRLKDGTKTQASETCIC